MLKALMKYMGVTEDQMREIFEKGHALVIDGHTQISTMNRRLERIERALGISETNETKAIENGNRERD